MPLTHPIFSLYGRDLFLAFLFACATFTACLRSADWDSALYREKMARDIWFDGDVNRVFGIETNRWEYNDRTAQHALYPYLTFPTVWAIRKSLGHSSETAVAILHSGIGGLWAASVFLLLRRIGLRRLDAVVFTVAGLTTSASMFWLPATETFVLGSITILVSLALAAGPVPPALSYFLAGILSLGVTVTNWMATFFGMLVDLPLRKLVLVTVATVIVCLSFALLHVVAFPQSAETVTSTRHELPWIFSPESNGPFGVMRTFFFSSIVAPEIRFIENFRQPAWPCMTMQAGGLFTATRWSWIATPAWIALLASGFLALATLKDAKRFRVVLFLTFLYQLLLHLLYGRETFLYSMQFMPLLVVIASLSALSRWRTPVLALAALLILSNSLNNFHQLSWARDYARRHAAIKAVEPEIQARIRKTIPQRDPAILYRFTRDVLGWGPPLAPDWDQKPR